MSTETEQPKLIDLIANHSRSLLENHWRDILSFRDEVGDIRITFTHTLSYEGDTRTVKTAISFARRIKDELEDSVSARQIEFKMSEEDLKRAKK